MRKAENLEKKVVVRMAQEQYDNLARLAEEDNRTIPNYIRWVLRKDIEEKTFRSSGTGA